MKWTLLAVVLGFLMDPVSYTHLIHSDRQGMSGFPHMYYYSNLQVPEQFLRTCEERKA